jgi:hypothetical protein
VGVSAGQGFRIKLTSLFADYEREQLDQFSSLKTLRY